MLQKDLPYCTKKVAINSKPSTRKMRSNWQKWIPLEEAAKNTSITNTVSFLKLGGRKVNGLLKHGGPFGGRATSAASTASRSLLFFLI